eukprot:EG_transcript_1961
MDLDGVRAKLRPLLDIDAAEWNFSRDGIGDSGTKMVAKALKTNDAVQKIILRWNNISPEGVKALVEALQSNTTLRELDLSKNAVQLEGVIALAAALRTNSTLQKLNLRDTDIGQESAKRIAEALQTNTTLQEVDLGDNNIGVNGARALRDALEQNSTLQRIGLDKNEISDTLLKDINYLLTRPRKKPSNGKSTKPAADCTEVPLEAAEAGLVDAVQPAVDPPTKGQMAETGGKGVSNTLPKKSDQQPTGPQKSKVVSNTLPKKSDQQPTGPQKSKVVSNTLPKKSDQQPTGPQKRPSKDKSTKPAADCTEVLLEAAQAGLVFSAQSAVEAGTSLVAIPTKGQTALQLAAQHGHPAAVHVTAVQGPEGTPQLAAVFWQEVAAGHADLVEYLLGAGGYDVDQTTVGGATALGVAAQHGHAAVVLLLLQAKANVYLADNSGHTPLASACAEGHLEVATLLISAQAQVDREDNAGRTPLYVACQNGHLTLVPLLLYAQARIDHAAKDGSTPASIASKNGHREVTMLLETAQSSEVFYGPAPPPAVTPPTPATRKRNRWGEGLEAPAAGNRNFFPTGWEPQRDVEQAIKVFGHDATQLQIILCRGKQIASEVRQIDAVSVDEEHAAAVFAYTQEDPVTQLYTRCNEACRTTGAKSEKRLGLFRDYLYHLDRAISVLPAFVGITYRGVRVLMPPDCYALGKKVTWQAFSSTTRSAPRTVPFLEKDGNQLKGSVFVLRIWRGRDITDFSAFPEEQEVLLGLNSAFKVIGRCWTLKEKHTAVPALDGYDLTQLDVYLMREL